MLSLTLLGTINALLIVDHVSWLFELRETRVGAHLQHPSFVGRLINFAHGTRFRKRYCFDFRFDAGLLVLANGTMDDWDMDFTLVLFYSSKITYWRFTSISRET